MDQNQIYYNGQVYKHASSKHTNPDLEKVATSNAYRRQRNLHSHHHYQRIRLKSAPPTGGGFLYNFNYHESMVVCGIGSNQTNPNNDDDASSSMKNNELIENVRIANISFIHQFEYI